MTVRMYTLLGNSLKALLLNSKRVAFALFTLAAPLGMHHHCIQHSALSLNTVHCVVGVYNETVFTYRLTVK